MSSSRISRALVRATSSRAHVRYASTAFRMPAMSPTMTEGGIASWKLKEGEAFAAGDVLIEIETDKATIDVEAQDDGVLGKIISEAGSSKIPVGQVIAMLAEEGDDLASIQVPKDLGPEGSASASSSEAPKEEKAAPKEEKKEESKQETSGQSGSQPKSTSQKSDTEVGRGHKKISHPKPLFPSVSRLLQESSLTSEQITKLKGTGKGGMLTKGDVLVALGQLKNPWGSAEKLNMDIMGASGKRKSEAATTESTVAQPAPPKKEAPLDAAGLRRLIVAGMAKATQPTAPIIPKTTNPLPLSSDAEFDSILAPYTSLLPPAQPNVTLPSPETLQQPSSRDEWAGLY